MQAGGFVKRFGQNLVMTQEIATCSVKEYVGEARKGLNLDRPIVQQMFRDAAAGLFDMVVVTFRHRLGRGDAYTNARYELGKHKVSVDLVKEAFGADLAGYYQEKCTNIVDGVPSLARLV